MPPPDARIWVGRGHAGLDHEVEPVAQAEGDALEHRPGQVPPVVPERQPDERAAGQRVGMRAALAGQVGQEEQAVAAGGHVRGRRRRGPRTTTPGASASRNQRRLPAADSITDIRCQRPGHRVAERVDAARAARTTAGRSRRRRRPTSRATAPSCPATRPRRRPRWPPGRRRRPRPASRRAARSRRRPRSVTAPVTCGPSNVGGSQRRGRSRAPTGPRRTSRARPGRTGACPTPSALSMAWSPVSRRRR